MLTEAHGFLDAANTDPQLAAMMGEADGDLPALVAIAAKAGYNCTEEELVAAYDQWVRAVSAGSPSDLAHAAVYLERTAPSDLAHAAVYLERAAAPSDLAHAAVYLGA